MMYSPQRYDPVVLFDTSYGTSNQGDFIINEAISDQMKSMLDRHFVVRYPTHTPLLHIFQNFRSNYVRTNTSRAQVKFICGTNILASNLLRRTPGWNINILTANLYRGSVTIGCGTDSHGAPSNHYTRRLYREVLSNDHVHSVRDLAAQSFVESLGLRAINTGCPTTWGLTPEHCREIPERPASRVLFTLTDYARNPKLDRALVAILRKHYRSVLFWVQGTTDLEYISSLEVGDDISVVAPNLEALREELLAGDIDYVGTRLHAGIFAMQHRIRSIILAVDNRARDMRDSANIYVIERADLSSVENAITSAFSTRVTLDVDAIGSWKAQFDVAK